MDIEQKIVEAARKALEDGLSGMLTSYNSPLQDIVKQSVAKHAAALSELVDESLSELLGDPKFAEELRTSMRTAIARSLVQKFGGEIEKRVNDLKADPSTRAKITLAIAQIAKESK